MIIIIHCEKKQDEYLYSRFVEIGGRPEEKHPLSFVIEGSDYLYDWFDQGIISRLRLNDILPCHVSFTIGDSGAEYQKSGKIDLLTTDELKKQMLDPGNDFDNYMNSLNKRYIEAQLWSDKYIPLKF